MNRNILFILVFFFATYAAVGQTDTLYQRDSVIEMEADCTESFFMSSERVTNPANVVIVGKNGVSYSMPTFREVNKIQGFSSSALADLDGDGKKELVITNFTGGAHCCDEVYVFRNMAPNRFRYASRTYAGHVCFSDDNKLTYSFYEHFGYFFTCYACSYVDTSDTAPIPVSSIDLIFKNGKLTVVPGDKTLESMIRDNLGKLAEQPYVEMSEVSQDNGLRKEFALNLAVYYYAFGRSLQRTKFLFDKFYTFPDAAVVWKEFNSILANIRKKNDF